MLMRLHFFDSCALQHRYLDSPYSRRVRGLISRSGSECYISEWSILEMSSAFANRSRRGGFSTKSFDRLNDYFLKDVATGKLNVCNISARDFIRARDLLRFAGVVKRRNLKSGDAMVATSCLSLALERKKPVVFYTSDWTLFDTIRGIDAFASRLHITFLGVPRN